MFLVTQLIGLAVIYSYTPKIEQVMINGTLQNITINPLPYGMDQPESECSFQDENFLKNIGCLTPILIAFIFAILLVFLLIKFKAATIMRIWFSIVVIIVLAITFNAFFHLFISNQIVSQAVSFILALPFAYYKIIKRNILIHNLTELFIYPGIAVVFIPLLNIWTTILLLIIISVYDIWAVWHSGFMQKMAKYQINELKLFGGFFVPYLNKKQRKLIKEAKSKNLSKKKFKVNLAILGGGDVVFPIITAGVIFRMWGLSSALIIVLFSTLSLIALFIFAKKGKFYPAMPFLTAGLFTGILTSYFFRIFF